MLCDSQLAAEIRAPLAGLIEMADLLLESGLPEPQREFAVRLRRAAADLLRRVETALEGANAGGAIPEQYEFDVRAALDTAVACCRSTAAGHARVSVALEPAMAETVVADGRRIVYLAAEMISAAVSSGGEEAVLRASVDDRGSLSLEVGPVGPNIVASFASELASRLGGELRCEGRAGRSWAFVARLPVLTAAAAGV